MLYFEYNMIMYGYVCVRTEFWEVTGGSCHAVERVFVLRCLQDRKLIDLLGHSLRRAHRESPCE